MELLKCARMALPLLAITLLITPVSAQANTRRAPGMWFALGAGAGSAKISCDGCRGESNTGPSATVGLGYSVSRQLQVAAEVTGWGRPLTGDRTTVGHAGLMLYAYPLGHHPLVLGVGAGFSRYVDKTSRDGESQRNRLQGLGVRGSLGYDLPLSPGLTITPTIGVHRSLSGTLNFNNEASDLKANAMVLDAGIVLRWHWGTPIRSK